MEIKFKENTYDGPGMSVNVPSEQSSPGFFALDYTESDNADEIDRGIRETIKGIRLSILAMGIGLATIKTKYLYKDLGCETITKYIQRLCDETKMDRSSIFRYLCIGEVYLKYKNDLELAGFIDSDGPTKLPYLERALEKNQKQEVFDNIKSMSVREFVNFAKGQTMTGLPFRKRDRWKINIRGNSVYLDGKLAIILSKKIDPRVSDYFMKVIHVACEAVEKEGLILPVFLRNIRDARRFEPVVEKMKAKMGMK